MNNELTKIFPEKEQQKQKIIQKLKGAKTRGDAFKILRTSMGKTLTEVSQDLEGKISESTISRVENDNSTSPKNIETLLSYYNLSESDLIPIEDSQSINEILVGPKGFTHIEMTKARQGEVTSKGNYTLFCAQDDSMAPHILKGDLLIFEQIKNPDRNIHKNLKQDGIYLFALSEDSYLIRKAGISGVDKQGTPVFSIFDSHSPIAIPVDEKMRLIGFIKETLRLHDYPDE